ncbi:MAG: SGNH/GDSL hydrolase family protein [Anaerolineales bacterium]|nr:SGNH/GDSL hydrolase family protein [Anaerolineales bacterium]
MSPSTPPRLRLSLWLAALGCLLASCAPATPAPTSTLPAATPSVALSPRPAPPKLGSFDPAGVAAINLNDYPIIPEISANARAVYAAGLAAGNNPRVFSKLGDCMTENPHFLVTFAQGQYDLGAYRDLQAVLDQFSGVPARRGDWQLDSFGTVGLAAAAGFNIAGPLDATWANPQWCQAGESPAACEFRVAQPTIAVIMFGTNDVAFTDAATFDYFYRTLVINTLNANVLPLLSTFPTRPEDEAKSLLLNQIVVQIAHDYAVPLLNLNRALAPLPDHGVDPNDTIHLSAPPEGHGRVDVFTPDNLQYGFTMRNLVTLQALQAVLAAVQ